jgi:hypothetical protein
MAVGLAFVGRRGCEGKVEGRKVRTRTVNKAATRARILSISRSTPGFVFASHFQVIAPPRLAVPAKKSDVRCQDGPMSCQSILMQYSSPPTSKALPRPMGLSTLRVPGGGVILAAVMPRSEVRQYHEANVSSPD